MTFIDFMRGFWKNFPQITTTQSVIYDPMLAHFHTWFKRSRNRYARPADNVKKQYQLRFSSV
jgi:hypothetical protein